MNIISYPPILDSYSTLQLREEVDYLYPIGTNKWIGIYDEPENTVEKYIQDSFDFYLKDQEDITKRIKDLGLQDDLINHKGLTPGMLVTLGEQKILKLEDFADLASDELTGDYDIVKGEKVKIQGYLEDFALSKTEADELIMSARKIIYKD